MSKKDKLKDTVVEEVQTQQHENAETETSKEEQQEDVVEKLEADLKTEKDRYLRLFAEFENYKKRTGRERIELFKTASQDVMVAMLPV